MIPAIKRFTPKTFQTAGGRSYRQMLIQEGAHTSRCSYRRMLIQADEHTGRCSYRWTLIQADAHTGRCSYRRTLIQADAHTNGLTLLRVLLPQWWGSASAGCFEGQGFKSRHRLGIFSKYC